MAALSARGAGKRYIALLILCLLALSCLSFSTRLPEVFAPRLEPELNARSHEEGIKPTVPSFDRPLVGDDHEVDFKPAVQLRNSDIGFGDHEVASPLSPIFPPVFGPNELYEEALPYSASKEPAGKNGPRPGGDNPAKDSPPVYGGKEPAQKDRPISGSQEPDEHDAYRVWSPLVPQGVDADRLGQVDGHIAAIMDPKDRSFQRLRCPQPIQGRYESLRRTRNLASRLETVPKQWFFAINLSQSAHVLPRLLSSVVEVMRFLRPEDCVLSVVAGPSDDRTTEILLQLHEHMAEMNVTYFFTTSDIDPLEMGTDRTTELAKIRNIALEPLTQQPWMFSSDATVIYLNDVSICPDDVLELIFQKSHQQAHLTCAMDWSDHGDTFHETWTSRTIKGDLFVEVPQSGTWEFKKNIFWNDRAARARFDLKLPMQVFSCWGGAAVFTAQPLLRHGVGFRASYQDECYMGETMLFCKDFWAAGYGRIAMVPSVNVAYNDKEGRWTKNKQGYTTQTVLRTERSPELSQFTKIRWQQSPPQLIKCDPDWTSPSWVEWNEAPDRIPFDWSHSGYFNADRPVEEEAWDDELVWEEDDFTA